MKTNTIKMESLPVIFTWNIEHSWGSYVYKPGRISKSENNLIALPVDPYSTNCVYASYASYASDDQSPIMRRPFTSVYHKINKYSLKHIPQCKFKGIFRDGEELTNFKLSKQKGCPYIFNDDYIENDLANKDELVFDCTNLPLRHYPQFNSSIISDVWNSRVIGFLNVLNDIAETNKDNFVLLLQEIDEAWCEQISEHLQTKGLHALVAMELFGDEIKYDCAVIAPLSIRLSVDAPQSATFGESMLTHESKPREIRQSVPRLIEH